MQLLYTKEVDKSLLWDGFTIKSTFLESLLGVIGRLSVGESRVVKIMLGDRIYDNIKLGNRNFNREKYPTHGEMYQIRYSSNSEFSQALRSIFADIWNFIEISRQSGCRSRTVIPENLRAQVAFYTSEDPDVLIAEPYFAGEFDSFRSYVKENQINEHTIEGELPLSDPKARVTVVEGVQRIRQLDRRVGDSLKQLYGFRCQVCGCEIGSQYGSERHVIEAHHIQPFSESFNNNFDNIMVLCPNHHRVVHTYHGEFHRRSREFIYPNGYREALSLNLHL